MTAQGFVKRIFACIGIAFLPILQMSFIAALPMPLGALNLSLVAMTTINFLFGLRPAFLSALAAGLVADTFSAYPFGIVTGALLLSAAVSDAVFSRFLTNRSLYSLLFLGTVSTIMYSVILRTGAAASRLAFGENAHQAVSLAAVTQTAWQLVSNLLALTFLFAFAWIASKRLRSTFVTS